MGVREGAGGMRLSYRTHEYPIRSIRPHEPARPLVEFAEKEDERCRLFRRHAMGQSVQERAEVITEHVNPEIHARAECVRLQPEAGSDGRR